MSSTKTQDDCGQATNETIITTVLVAVTVIVAVGLLGRTLKTDYLCVARSLVTGEACSGEGRSGGDPSGDGRGADLGDEEPTSGSGPGQQGSASGAAGGSSSGGPLDRLLEAMNILRSVPEGQALYNYLDQAGTRIELVSGTGASYSPKTGRIYLGENKSAAAMATAIAHEQVHLDWNLTGVGAGGEIGQIGEPEYTRRMLEEEVTATIAEIQMAAALRRAGIRFNHEIPGEAQYQRALAAGGEQAAREAVRRLFLDGTFVGSRSRQPYPVIWRNRWYASHPEALGADPTVQFP